ncbi:hypothetical protein [Flagellimonas aequoris]|uniref:DUF5678 domain-containing protein n=1 Tax=Flagellimonas aequoris TaxID=2306997 RepID=A0A418NB18_9FLAO|nr:hypothetical protein [Allomuricauda aequoris]RIV73186.1 hypothetical protein D2U88_03330 [Allomuricauda aequoris]TXK06997.1 hypothetical protein FQ019_03305 [Allomuricauda aequoris]
MATYKEQQKGKKYFVLIEDGVPLGTFGNLKKVVEFMDGKDFPSYWTLVRYKVYPIVHGNYKIYKVSHF